MCSAFTYVSKDFYLVLSIVKITYLCLQFPHHTLTVEAAASELFVDQDGNYWNVPFSVAADLASVASDSGTSYHFCINHVSGLPLQIGDESTSVLSTASFPALCAKIAVSMKKNIDIWRSEGPKLKMVQPYDMFLSNPHISASALLGKNRKIALY